MLPNRNIIFVKQQIPIVFNNTNICFGNMRFKQSNCVFKGVFIFVSNCCSIFLFKVCFAQLFFQFVVQQFVSLFCSGTACGQDESTFGSASLKRERNHFALPRKDPGLLPRHRFRSCVHSFRAPYVRDGDLIPFSMTMVCRTCMIRLTCKICRACRMFRNTNLKQNVRKQLFNNLC